MIGLNEDWIAQVAEETGAKKMPEKGDRLGFVEMAVDVVAEGGGA